MFTKKHGQAVTDTYKPRVMKNKPTNFRICYNIGIYFHDYHEWDVEVKMCQVTDLQSHPYPIGSMVQKHAPRGTSQSEMSKN